ncbi:MAG: hypothetical protein WCA79_09765 [Anaerolineales bacterium]
MKKLTFGSMLVIVALLLSSCQLHTGLGSLLGGKKSSSGTPGAPTKHIKATHTPPSPKTPSANGTIVAPTATPASSNDAVSITGAGFQSNALMVKVGTSVSWTNNDSATHTVTSDTSGVFDSGPINQGTTYKFTFTQAGMFNYHSMSDPSMTGTITVTQ